MSGIITDNLGKSSGLMKAAGGGKVLQVLQATDTTQRSTSGTDWDACSNTMSQAITCSATSSKVLVMVNFTGQSGSYATGGTIFRDSTNLGDATYGMGKSSGANIFKTYGFVYLDDPGDTSEHVYTVKVISASGGTTYINRDGTTGAIILMEIGA